MSHSFSFVVLSYQSAPHIEACLRAICAQDGDFEVIWADNGSWDADYFRIAARFETVRFIKNATNLGFARGNNEAAKLARGEWLCLINPDAFVAKDWLKTIGQAIETHPDVSIFTSLQRDAHDLQKLDGAGDAMSLFGFPFRMGYGHRITEDLSDGFVFSPCGAAMVIRRALFETLGGFEESFFCYCEDADLGFRAQLRGQRTLFVARAEVLHVGSASLGLRSDFALYHGYRNRLWLYGRNMPLIALWLTLPFHIAITALFFVKDVIKGGGKAAGQGVIDALAGLPKILAYRKKVQKNPPAHSQNTLRAMTFNPIRGLRRDIDHRSF